MSVTPWEQPVVPKLKRATLETLLSRGVRLDNRKLYDYRSIDIEPGYVDYRAEGSALVRLGQTTVLAGVKMDLVPPFPDTPNEGVLVVHAEFVPLASPSFEPGPPDENAIELARVIDRSLREPKAVALDKLVIEPGKTVWRVYVDIYVLNHDGNLFDASMLAAMAALMTTRIPAYTKTEDGYRIVRGSYTGLLPINRRVVTVHLAKIAGKLLVDPSYEEELVSDARIVIAVTEDGLIGGMQKMGHDGLYEQELENAVNIAVNKSKELFRILAEKVEPYVEKLRKEIEEAAEKPAEETPQPTARAGEAEEEPVAEEPLAASEEGEARGD